MAQRIPERPSRGRSVSLEQGEVRARVEVGRSSLGLALHPDDGVMPLVRWGFLLPAAELA